jgi:hypothetical protein
VAGQVEAVVPESGRDGEDVCAQLAHPVRLNTHGTGASGGATLAGGDGSIPGGGQTVECVVPAGAGLRESVEQKNELTIRGSADERVEPHASCRYGRASDRHGMGA